MAIVQKVQWTINKGTSPVYSDTFTGTTDGEWNDVYAGLLNDQLLNGFTVSAKPVTVDDEKAVDDPDYVVDVFDHTHVETSIEAKPDSTQYIDPAITLFSVEQEGISFNESLCGIENGSEYVYPVVFTDSKFCYLPACSGSGTDFSGEVCTGADNRWFPTEPLDPLGEPPVYPMDSITSFNPTSMTERVIEYTVTFKWRVITPGAPDLGSVYTSTLNLTQTVLAPQYDWGAMLNSMITTYTYFGNGIYH